MDSYGVMQPAKLIKNRQVWTYLPSELSLRTEHTVSKQSIQEHNTRTQISHGLGSTSLVLFPPQLRSINLALTTQFFLGTTNSDPPFFFFTLARDEQSSNHPILDHRKESGGRAAFEAEHSRGGGGRCRQTDSWMDSLIRSTKIDREAHEKMKRRGLGERKGERARRAGLREKSDK